MKDKTKHTQDYHRMLGTCTKVANIEFNFAQNCLQEVKSEIDTLETELEKAISKQKNKAQIHDQANERLLEIKQSVNSSMQSLLADTTVMLSKKRVSISKYTVTLFGRTMAGKSTIREAITLGDGSTIGKGAQRTTRDVSEYEWNILRIIDTPGIGAYEGDEDQKLALSIVDESDLLLFLVSSDSIQESTFQGMKAIRSLNKPVVFVLNVKKDMTKGINLRRFLQNPLSILGETAISGFCNRIKTLAKKELGMQNVVIIPVHAQAAYLSTCPDYQDKSDQLIKASNLDTLMRALTNEVKKHGHVRRLQTFLDGTVIPLSKIEMTLHEQAIEIQENSDFIQSKYEELKIWLDSYFGKVAQCIKHDTNNFLSKLRNDVSTFIDENIDAKDVLDRWNKKVDGLHIDEWVRGYKTSIHEEVRTKLIDFKNEVDFDRDVIVSFRTKGPDRYSPFDYKKALNWTSAIAFFIGGAIFWNPVGWIAGAIGVLSKGISWLFKSRDSKVQRYKATASEQLRGQIDQYEEHIIGSISNWFDKEVKRKLVKGVSNDTGILIKGMHRIANRLNLKADNVFNIIAKLNRRLIVRTASLQMIANIKTDDIGRIVRIPGIKTKFIWDKSPDIQRFNIDVGYALNETVESIEHSSHQEMIARALCPAKVDPEQVIIDEVNLVTVVLDKEQINKAVGKSNYNISLACSLLNSRIILQEVK